MRDILAMGWRRASALAALGAAALIFVAACTGGQGSAPSPTPTGEASPSPVSFPTGMPSGAVTGEASQCEEGSGPPQTGGGEGLEGTITFVRLVFGCSPDVYAMDADGNGATNLSDNPALDDESDISRDGEKVVFFSLREEEAQIYVMNADGSGLQRLTEGAGDVSPRWSPDGSRIAFSRSGSLAMMNADGSDLHIIMEAQASDEAEPCRAGSFVGGWSPDGRRLTYYSAILRSGGSNTFWVCTIDADGSNLEVLVTEPDGELHAEPHWSPDGQKIVFREEDGDCSTGGGSCNYEVYVLDLQTRKLTNVTGHPSLDIEPVWSPDGEWILFASNRDDPNFDLYVVRPDGSDLRRLLDDPEAKDSYPSWAP